MTKSRNFLLFFVSLVCILEETNCGVYSSFKPNYPCVAALNCSFSTPNVYFDLTKQQWEIQRYSACANTEKDILSLCERVYPQYYIKSVLLFRRKTKYFINECKNGTRSYYDTHNGCQYKVVYASPYKCMYEATGQEEDNSDSYEIEFNENDSTFSPNLGLFNLDAK